MLSGQGAPNNSFNRSGLSLVSHPSAWMLSSLCPARLDIVLRVRQISPTLDMQAQLLGVSGFGYCQTSLRYDQVPGAF